MADILISKATAAQRQIDAAIRMLFAGEDPLAVHTVAAAAKNIIDDLASQRGTPVVNEINDMWADTVRSTFTSLSGAAPSEDAIRDDLQSFRKWFRGMTNRPANFLKHADTDASGHLNMQSLETDFLLLQACTVYRILGSSLRLKSTPSRAGISPFILTRLATRLSLLAEKFTSFLVTHSWNAVISCCRAIVIGGGNRLQAV